MKSLIIRVLPGFILKQLRHRKIQIERNQNRNKSSEEIFTNIYVQKKWGGAQDQFSSGPGTSNEQSVSPYISMIKKKISDEKLSNLTFVDLGCGDFTVGRQLLPMCSHYIGVDVVKPVIQENKKRYGNDQIKFMHLDIVNNELPDGDVCFIRQVLQHLSNKQILNILKKLKKYPRVFITEHYPTHNENIIPNLDKIQGSDVRVYDNSGVFLTEPPFSIEYKKLEQMLEVPGVGLGKGDDPGVIRTYLYKP